jgi:hypothetical membrane protein
MHRIAGLFFFLGGSIVILGIMSAEIFYPGYSISLNMISNLAATPPPDSIVREPSADIFDFSMLISGIFITCGAYCLYRSKYRSLLAISVAVMGMAASAVGIFPAYHAILHPVVAFTTFLAGGIAAILSANTVGIPFKYIAFGCGAVSIALLLLGIFSPDVLIPYLGKGGVERWVAYPTLLWLIGYGGYLMNVRKA